MMAERKRFRVGYFVYVDVEAYDEHEAGIVGEAACGWPGNWAPAHEPIPVEGQINGHTVTAQIVRSVTMMVRQTGRTE